MENIVESSGPQKVGPLFSKSLDPPLLSIYFDFSRGKLHLVYLCILLPDHVLITSHSKLEILPDRDIDTIDM